MSQMAANDTFAEMVSRTSPLLQAAVSTKRRVTVTSKHATPLSVCMDTPELPLLQEVSHELSNLDSEGLLPAAAIDWQEAVTPTTGLPASPDAEESEEDVSEGRFQPTTVLELCQEAMAWAPMEAESCQKADLLSPIAVSAESVDNCIRAESVDNCIPMWCLTRELEDGSLFITPIGDGSDEKPPQVAGLQGKGGLKKMWCSVQLDDVSGQWHVVPYTEPEADQVSAVLGALVDEEAPKKQKGTQIIEQYAAFAPWLLPTEGAFAPQWANGCCFPFSEAPTTLRLSDLPDDYTQETLLEILDREEFSGLYDFVYLPDEAETNQVQRSALVNLIDNRYALTLAAKLNGKMLTGEGGASSCTVSWSLPCQGLKTLVEVYRTMPQAEEATVPQLFDKGWPVDLPPVTN